MAKSDKKAQAFKASDSILKSEKGYLGIAQEARNSIKLFPNDHKKQRAHYAPIAHAIYDSNRSERQKGQSPEQWKKWKEKRIAFKLNEQRRFISNGGDFEPQRGGKKIDISPINEMILKNPKDSIESIAKKAKAKGFDIGESRLKSLYSQAHLILNQLGKMGKIK